MLNYKEQQIEREKLSHGEMTSEENYCTICIIAQWKNNLYQKHSVTEKNSMQFIIVQCNFSYYKQLLNVKNI
jgi:hypothetical protein